MATRLRIEATTHRIARTASMTLTPNPAVNRTLRDKAAQRR